MIELSYLSAVRFSGDDAGDFLHNQLSADIQGLTNGQSTLACYCEPKGRVLALMLVYRFDDDYFVIMSRSLVPTVAGRLKIYVMRSKVSIEILDECTVSALQAGDSQRSDTSIAAIPLPDSDQSLLLGNEKTPVADAALQAAWKVAELRRGITWLNPETSGQFLPQMLGFDQLGAVNFRKGCYPGQEIVARTHYLGKVKRHPRQLCTTAFVRPLRMDKIQIHSGDQTYAAIVVDSAYKKDSEACLFVVTRMDPDLVAEKIEWQDQVIPLAGS